MSSAVSPPNEHITFRHNFAFNIGPTFGGMDFSERRESAFLTVHGMAAYEWRIICGPERLFNWHRNANRRWVLELMMPAFASLSDRVPHPIDATFHLSILDDDENEVCPLVSQTVLPQTIDDDPQFRLRNDSKIVSKILWAREIQAKLEGTGRRLTAHLCTMLRLKATDFRLQTEWIGTASSPPNLPDFRFDAILDRSRHNITIACLNGRVKASKEALFHASTYFRTRLLEPDAVAEITEQSTCLAVEQLIVYMLTETFSHQGPMSVEHAAELFQLIQKYHPLRRIQLVHSIERCLLIQLDQKRTDLLLMIKHFMIGIKNGLDRLATAAGAVIYELHFNDYMLDYGIITETNRANHALISELQANEGFFRPSPHTKLMTFYPKTRNVQIVHYTE